jgi:hypothetical protein
MTPNLTARYLKREASIAYFRESKKDLCNLQRARIVDNLGFASFSQALLDAVMYPQLV